MIEDTVQGLVPSSGNGLKIPLDFLKYWTHLAVFFFFNTLFVHGLFS